MENIRANMKLESNVKKIKIKWPQTLREKKWTLVSKNRQKHIFNHYILVIFSIWCSSFYNFHYSPSIFNLSLILVIDIVSLMENTIFKLVIQSINYVVVFCKWDDDNDQNDNKFKNIWTKMKIVKTWETNWKYNKKVRTKKMFLPKT